MSDKTKAQLVAEVDSLRRRVEELEQRNGDAPGVAPANNCCAANVIQSQDLFRTRECEFRELLDTIPHGIQECDALGVITFSNAAHSRMLGYEEGELVGKLIWEVLDDDVRQSELREHLASLVSEQSSPTTYFNRNRTKDGKSIDVQVDWAYKRDDLGNVTGFISVITDITARKQDEERLQKAVDQLRLSEERLKAITENFPDFVVQMDAAGRIRYINRTLKQNTYEDVVGTHMFEWMEPEYQQAAKDAHDRALSTRETQSYEFLGPGHDDARRWYACRVSCIAGAGEESVIHVVRDVTPTKQAADRLRESEARLAAVTTNSSDHVMLIDGDGTIRYINYTVTDLNVEQVLGTSIHEYVPERSRQVMDECLKRVLESGQRDSFETDYETASGEILHFESRVAPVMRGDEVESLVVTASDITRRVRTERELAEKEARLRQITNDIPGVVLHAISTRDAPLVLSYVSNGVSELLGWSAEQVTAEGFDPFSLVVDEDREPFKQAMLQAVLTDSPLYHELRFNTVWGKTNWGKICASFSMHSDGSVEWNGVALDITARKRAEQELQNRVLQMELVAKIGQLALDSSDLDALMDATVAAACEGLQVEYSKILELQPDGGTCLLKAGRGWNNGSIGHATVPMGINSQVDFTLAAREPVIVKDQASETRFARPEILFTHNVVSGASVVIGNASKPYGVLGIHTTVSREFTDDDIFFFLSLANILSTAIERQRSEQRLRASEARLNAFFDRAPVGMVLLDEHFRYLKINTRLAEINGIGLKEHLGKTLQEVVPHIAPKIEAMYRRILTTGEPVLNLDLSGEVPSQPGSVRHWIISQFRIQDDAPDNCVFGAVVVEITESRRAQEQLRQHQEKLAHVARLSTLGEMATGLAHELNQPFGAISNYCFVGKQVTAENEAPDPAQLRELFDKLGGQAMRAGEIIRRLRNFIRQRGPVRSWVDVIEPIQEVLHLLEADLRQSEVRVDLQADPSRCVAVMDDIQIQQVLVNLIRNALNAMSKTERNRRTLKITVSETADNLLEVAVCDAGKGIPLESSDQIFDAFFSSKHDGLGMGLAISRTIVQSHGGRLWMTPNPDCGVTFHFTLPRTKDGDDDGG